MRYGSYGESLKVLICVLSYKLQVLRYHIIISYWTILTHWGRVTHICISKLTIIGSDNGLAPDRRQAIIWTISGLLLIGPLGTNFSEILIEILTFSFKKMRLKVSSAKRRPFCLSHSVLTCELTVTLLWHCIRVMAFQITGNSTIWSTTFSS